MDILFPIKIMIDLVWVITIVIFFIRYFKNKNNNILIPIVTILTISNYALSIIMKCVNSEWNITQFNATTILIIIGAILNVITIILFIKWFIVVAKKRKITRLKIGEEIS